MNGASAWSMRLRHSALEMFHYMRLEQHECNAMSLFHLLLEWFGFPSYPVRGRGWSGRRFFDAVLNVIIGGAQV
jgi:hypothetical protein